MSDDRDVLALLDRASAHTPPLHLARDDVVARGEQLVRRRRAGRGGVALGALALAGAVWLGSAGGGGAGLLETRELVPAGMGWEVDGPAPVELPDGLRLVGNVEPLTLGRTSGSSSATFVVDGRVETVSGRTMPGGVEVYKGRGATVMVWDHPSTASGFDVVPSPQGSGGSAEVVVGGEDLVYWVTDEAGYEPEDLVLHDEDDVWTASGQVAETAELRDEGVRVTGYALPGLGLVGYLAEGALNEVDRLAISGVTRPWWRGGGHELTTVARLPQEAVFTREVRRGQPGGPVVEASETRSTQRVGPYSMVLFADPWGGGGSGEDSWYDIQWSTDGQTWHDQPLELEPVPPAEEGEPVGPGGSATLLGAAYRVATDEHGWPRLVDADGGAFVSFTDELGPHAGGLVDMDGGLWPWRTDARIHFYVGWQPPAGADVLVAGDDGRWLEPQDVVTVASQEGAVTLVSLPPGLGHDTGGLGLRHGDGPVRPVSP